MIPIIDNGHGGVENNQYLTPPRIGKFYTFSDGTTIHEGEFNRAITARVIESLYNKGIPYYVLVPEQRDISLKKKRDNRVLRTNKLHQKHKGKVFLVSIHSNAGGGTGSEVFISKKASHNSQSLAAWTKALFVKHFPESSFRGIKRKNFTIITDTLCPAILVECFFMDNKHECKTYLKTKEGRDRIAAWIVDIIESFIKYHS